MGTVGLLYVGAVLFINGLMLLGVVNAKSAAPLNVFVGAMQVITPTWLIFTSRGDPDIILNASGLYLFGFTYLYVAWNLLSDLDGTGLGYFSLFVAICACVYAGLNFGRLGDTAFGVIWLMWAFLWLLFFLVLGLGKVGLSRYTGAVAAIEGWVTGVVPAFLLLSGRGLDYNRTAAIVLVIVAVVAFGALYPRLREHTPPVAPAPPTGTGTAVPTPGGA
jgi:putative amide transporter protein